MSWNDHDHRGEYAEAGHDHWHDYAEKYHRHYDDESTVQGVREDLGRAEERIRELQGELDSAFSAVREMRAGLDSALGRISALEDDTPQVRRLQLEADQAAADLAESGYDQHGSGCNCSYCYRGPEEDR